MKNSTLGFIFIALIIVGAYFLGARERSYDKPKEFNDLSELLNECSEYAVVITTTGGYSGDNTTVIVDKKCTFRTYLGNSGLVKGDTIITDVR